MSRLFYQRAAGCALLALAAYAALTDAFLLLTILCASVGVVLIVLGRAPRRHRGKYKQGRKK